MIFSSPILEEEFCLLVLDFGSVVNFLGSNSAVVGSALRILM